LLATALLLSRRLKNDPNSRKKAMSAWENAMFRLYVLADEDSRTRVGECVRLASEIRNGNPSVKQIIDRFNMVANVTPDQVAEVLRHVNAYQEWTSEEIIYFFWNTKNDCRRTMAKILMRPLGKKSGRAYRRKSLSSTSIRKRTQMATGRARAAKCGSRLVRASHRKLARPSARN